MRSLVKKLYKNPSFLFIGLLSFFIGFIILWYFTFYKGLSQNYEISKELEKSIATAEEKLQVLKEFE